MLRWRALGLAIGISLVSAACGGSAADTGESVDAIVTAPLPSDAIEPRAAPDFAPTADTERAAESTTTATTTTSAAPAQDHDVDDDVTPNTAPDASADANADRVWAEAARLRAADLPGWSSDGASAWNTPVRDTPVPAGCEHVRIAASIPTTASVDSPAFVDGDGLAELFNSISVFRDATTAQAMLAALDHDNTPDCFEQILVGQEGTISVDDATVTRVRLQRADGGVAYVAALTVSVGGRPYEFLARFAYARSRRSVSFMMAFGYEELPGETEPVFDAVLRRLAQT